ncbi:carbonic anhydrase [Pulveribacter sp.]|uniref:carbonic anhydrase n=1 Tax=Pulveribacter sp. TaxID=2678893 RepID=UPI0028A7BD39|nr:carbonic anhydrase [Pulveribacter sp.]
MCDATANPCVPALRRRRLLSATAFAALTPAWAAPPAPTAPHVSPDVALQQLLQGNARYVAGRPLPRNHAKGRAARAQGQRPMAAVLSCADSRVAPEILFDQGLGDLFVVRLAGNFVNDDALASMEYAVQFLQVPLLVVLGHSQCGAVAAAVQVVQDKAVLPGHLPGLAQAIQPAVESALRRQTGNLLATATVQNVRHNVARLATAAPILADRAATGATRTVGGVYDLATGAVTLV